MDAIDTFRSLLGLGPREPGADTTPATAPAATITPPAATTAATPTGTDAVAVVQAATAAQVDALTVQNKAISAERDAYKAHADEYAALVRADAFAQCVRALGPERAKAEEARILGAVVMGEDGKPTDQRTGGLALADAKVIRDTYAAAADARYGIQPDAGARRVTTVAALPTLDVTAEDVTGKPQAKIDQKAYYDALNNATRPNGQKEN